MTQLTRADAPRIAKKITLSAVLVTVELWAFTLSFNHHVQTAIGAGYSPDLAPLYPLVIDGAIVAATLVLVWWPQLSSAQRAYIWFAVAIWTGISGINNAISTLTDTTTAFAFPVELAIAIHTVPTVTQFLLLHIVYLALRSDQNTARRASLLNRITTTLRELRQPATTHDQEASRSPRPKASKARPELSGAAGVSVSSELLEEMMQRWDGGEGESFAKIAMALGVSKSYVGKTIKNERERRESASSEVA